jgi:hypothetical protein
MGLLIPRYFLGKSTQKQPVDVWEKVRKQPVDVWEKVRKQPVDIWEKVRKNNWLTFGKKYAKTTG